MLGLREQEPEADLAARPSGPAQRRPHAVSSRHSLPRGCACRQQRATVPHPSCSGIVFSAYLWSVVSSRCFSSFCLKLEGTWKVVLAAELGAEKLVEEERPAGAACCAPRALIEQRSRDGWCLPAPLCARRCSRAAPGRGQAAGAQRGSGTCSRSHSS